MPKRSASSYTTRCRWTETDAPCSLRYHGAVVFSERTFMAREARRPAAAAVASKVRGDERAGRLPLPATPLAVEPMIRGEHQGATRIGNLRALDGGARASAGRDFAGQHLCDYPRSMRDAKVIYLDHSVWSAFGKVAAGQLKAPDWVSARNEITRLRSAGRIDCPISLAHVAELPRWNNRVAREATITEMVRLSGGKCLPFVFDCIAGKAETNLCRAEQLMPQEAVSLYTSERLGGLSAPQALDLLLRLLSSAPDFVVVVERFINSMLAALEQDHPAALQPRPQAEAEPLAAWAKEICRLRVADPNQGVEPGDPFDILHVLYTGLVDAAVVDRKHAAMVSQSKFRLSHVVHKVQDLLALLGESGT